MSRLNDCKLITLHKHSARQGNLTAIEGSVDVPFDIDRVYYLYDLPGGESRGGHAHIDLQQLMVCVMGSFDVILDDGQERRKVHLDRAHQGLVIRPMVWRELENFSSGAICLVLASQVYREADYIRDYGQFVAAAADQHGH
jgi:hypothetical protein